VLKKSCCLFALLLSLGACVAPSSLGRRNRGELLDLPVYQIYLSTYDRVWDATVRVLDLYSIAVANRDSGLLQTEWSEFRSNRELFEVPDLNPTLEEVKYRLKIKLSKAYITETGQPAVRVQVIKELLEYKNIYSDWQRVPTDQIEESVILYRIGKKLHIIEELRKKSTGSTPDAPL
jgi:hypothetical protein